MATVSAEAAAVPRFAVTPFSWGGVECVAAGTGYTGEDGIECSVPTGSAVGLWEALLAAGVSPAGLGARDTLRLEAALPLHGHELGPGITPLQAKLGWVVGWDKPRFRGRQALIEERERGVQRILSGLATEGRQPPREGSILTRGDQPVGVVTSGNFSPMLEHGIALALVDSSVATQAGEGLTIELRGRAVPATVVRTPFVRAGQWESTS
jgi:aminomethyltransferase